MNVVERLLPCRRVGVVVSLVGLYLIAVVAAAAAQSAAGIIGQVTDESGGVLPGVTVTITSSALQVPELTSVTDERGEYRLTPLPIGSYRVVYALSGFQSIQRDQVVLTSGFVAKLDVAMKVGALEETITVSGASPVVDVTSTSTSTQLSAEILDAIPSSRQGVVSMMNMAPGVRPVIDIAGSADSVPVFRAFGQQSESWQTLEGVVTASPKAGQSGNYFDFSGLEEVNVKTVGADADMPSRGIQMSVLIKSGGNDFHGSGFYSYTNFKFNSDNINDELKAFGLTKGAPIRYRKDLSGDVGGRILRDKLWFYAGIQIQDKKQDNVGCYQVGGPDPDGTPCYYWLFNRFINVKTSYQMNKSNRFVFFAQPGFKDNEGLNTDALNPWPARFSNNLSLLTSKGEWAATAGNSLATSVQFGTWTWNSVYEGFSDEIGRLDTVTGLRTGLHFGMVGINPYERNYHTKGTVSWFKPDLLVGNHEFRGGFDYLESEISRSRVTRTALNPEYKVDRINVDYQLRLRSGAPFQLEAINSPVFPHNRADYFGMYVADNWTLARRLTLNLGLRFSHDVAFAPEQCREAATQWPTVYPAQCFPELKFKVFNSVAPRLHAALDVTGDGKTVVKGGWSRFDKRRDIDPDVVAANRNNQMSTIFLWRDLNGNGDYNPGESNLDLNGPDYVSQTNVGTSVINPNQLQPKSDEFMASVEREMKANLALRLTGVYSRGFDNLALQNNRRPYQVYSIPIRNTDPGPDNIRGNADDPGTVFTYFDYPTSLRGAAFEQGMLINDPRNDKNYRSVEVAAMRRLQSNWQFLTAYSATWKRVPFSAALPAFTPNEINTADNTLEWSYKLSGSYMLPWQLQASAFYEARSGVPWARTVAFTGGTSIPQLVVNVEPIGAREMPAATHLDFRLEKRIPLLRGQRAALRLNIYNALNANTILAVNTRSGSGLGVPTDILPPRVFDFSATFNF